MVISNEHRQDIIRRYALTPDEQARIILPMTELRGRQGLLHVDDLDVVLRLMFGVAIGTVTTSSEV